MKKILATLLASIIGASGIVCVDNEARELIAQNSEQINTYYSQYQEDYSNLSESITECSHVCNNYDEDISNLNNKIDNIDFPECSCKDYSHLEEQYNELYSKYEELSQAYEENKPKEYKVGDVVEIPIILGENTEKAIIEQSYVTITGINEYDMAHYYEVDVTVKGELIVPKRTYVVWLTLRNQGNDSYYSERVRIEWPSNQTGKHILDGVCLKAEINKIYLENNTVPIEIFVQYY